MFDSLLWAWFQGPVPHFTPKRVPGGILLATWQWKAKLDQPWIWIIVIIPLYVAKNKTVANNCISKSRTLLCLCHTPWDLWNVSTSLSYNGAQSGSMHFTLDLWRAGRWFLLSLEPWSPETIKKTLSKPGEHNSSTKPTMQFRKP